jgi:hypothetical protein
MLCQVKRSRESQRRKKVEHDVLCRVREEENQRLEDELEAMKEKMSFLVRAIAQPQTLKTAEQHKLRLMILAEAARELDHTEDSQLQILASASAHASAQASHQ